MTPDNDVQVRNVLIVLGLLFLLLAVLLVCVHGLVSLWQLKADHALTISQTAAPPAPGIETAPHPELIQFLTEKQTILNSYGWIDREEQIVRIPVEQAMQLLAHGKSEVP